MIINAWAADTDDHEVARQIQRANPPIDTHHIAAELPWPVGVDVPFYGEVEVVPLFQIRRTLISYRDNDFERFEYLRCRYIDRLRNPMGMVHNGRRLFPFSITERHKIMRCLRLPESGWSSDGTHTRPLYHYAGTIMETS